MMPSCLELRACFYSVFIDIMDTFRMFNALLHVAITFITASCSKMCCGLLRDDVMMQACLELLYVLLKVCQTYTTLSISTLYDCYGPVILLGTPVVFSSSPHVAAANIFTLALNWKGGYIVLITHGLKYIKIHKHT